MARVWLILGGTFVSTVGDRFAAIAFALYAVSIHSTALVAAVLAAELVPGMLFGLVTSGWCRGETDIDVAAGVTT